MNEPSRPSDETLVAAALARPAAERASFLAAACAGDAARRARVESLIRSNDLTQGVTLADAPTISPPPVPGAAVDRIGRYQILQKLGEGGCGTVYLAEQEEPVRRRVALKVIKLGMDTREVIALFEAERQVLAMMEHPNIAQVFDAGTTDSGRPFFVMELVHGVPITRYCDDQNLSVSARLKLFIQVCHAVQHAHQKGIIHRDLKPSNILVAANDGLPTPKVIDFGIAKATAGRLTDRTVYTTYAQFVGTPAYMSPEQAEMSSLDIDTRSDIYSLGVLLYELLTGRTPFETKELLQAGFDGMRRHIQKVEPPRPSTRLRTLGNADRATVAQDRQADGPKLINLIRGDLDWIVMRCLEKDRIRRYDTANGLAMDIQRHLNHEPVVAGPASPAYRFRKLVRRNRLAFAGVAAVAAALVLGLVASTWQAVRANRAERIARDEADRASAAEREQSRLREAAQHAQAREANLRQAAEAQELTARHRAYAADMDSVQQALEENNLGRARQLLYSQKPSPGQRDLRDWEWRYLWQFCQSEAQTVWEDEKKDAIFSLATSGDGQWAAIGRLGGNVSVVNLQTKEEIRLPSGYGAVRVAFSPSGPLLAMGIREAVAVAGRPRDRIILWNTDRRQVVREIALTGACRGLAFAKDGQRLAVRELANSAYRVTQWDMTNGHRLYYWEIPNKRVTSDSIYQAYEAFVINDDLTLMAMVLTNSVRVFDLKNKTERWNKLGSSERIAALAFSPDGKLLVSGGAYADATIQLWDVASGAELGQLVGHSSWIGQFVFLSDGKRLISCGADQTVRLWDVSSRKLILTLRGHETEVWRIALLPDEQTVLSGAKDGSLYRWRLDAEPRTFAPATLKKKGGFSWAFADGGDSVVTVGAEGHVARSYGRNFQNEEPLFEIGANEGSFFAPHHPLLAARKGTNLQIWDWDRRALVRELSNPNWSRPHFSQDGTKLATGHVASKSYAYREWDIPTGRETRSHRFPIPLVAEQTRTIISPDENQVVGISFPEGNVYQWDLQTGRSLSPSFKIVEAGSAPAFSPDGRLLAVPTYRSETQIFDAATYQKVGTLRGYMFGVNSATFSFDGRRLATGGSAAEAVTFWDTQNLTRVLRLKAPTGSILRMAFSPNGNVFAAQDSSGATSGTVFFWRAPSWKEIEAAEQGKRRGGEDDPETLALMHDLAKTYFAQGNVAEAAKLHERTLQLQRRVLGPKHPDTLASMHGLAAAYTSQRKFAEAAALHALRIEIQKEILGPDHPSTLASMDLLASAYRAQGEPAEAAALHLQTLEIRKRVLVSDDSDIPQSMTNVAASYEQAKLFANAEPYLREILAFHLRKLGADSGWTVSARITLGVNLLEQQKFLEGESQLREALAIREKKQPDAFQTFYTHSLLGAALAGQKKFAEAETFLLSGYNGMKLQKEATTAANKKRLREALERLGQLYHDWGQPEKAAVWKEKTRSP
jgi:eukaryotic-like serine/threonine-protein kinase